MALCTGVSQKKTASPDNLYLDVNFMASILPPTVQFLAPLLPYIPPITVLDVTTYCQSDPTPPDLTGITLAAVLAGGEISAALVAAGAIRDVVMYYLWFKLCECASGPAATPGTPPSNPGGIPAINPPTIVTGPLPTPCQEAVGSVRNPGGGSYSFVGNVTWLLKPVRLVRVTFDAIMLTGGGQSVTLVTKFYDSAGTDIGAEQHTYVVGPGTSLTTHDILAPAGAQGHYTNGTWGGGGGTTSVQVTESAYCGSDVPGVPTQPCCPPDSNVSGLLAQLWTAVTLIQRQGVPFGYIVSTAHTSLSGAGVISIADLLGVKVDVTTLPSSYGVSGTTPPEHFDLGWVTFGTPDGYPSAYRLTRDHQLMMPARCGLYTELDYDLAPGVVVDITEILREP